MKAIQASLVNTPILIIEDDPEQNELLTMMLANHQFPVMGCLTGQAALAACQEQKFEVVILDLSLPDMDGLDMLKHLKQHNAQIKVIIFTGHPSTESAISAVNQDVFAYIKKPEGSAVLLNQIDRACLIHYNETLEEKLKVQNDWTLNISD